MGDGIWMLKVTGDFSSSHQLRNYGGKCENLHGHNFEATAVVEGVELDPDVEILMDFKDLKKALNKVLDYLDHKHLNDLPEFADSNPSSENLARFIYKSMRDELPENVRLASVSVSEKDSSTAIYMER